MGGKLERRLVARRWIKWKHSFSDLARKAQNVFIYLIDGVFIIVITFYQRDKISSSFPSSDERPVVGRNFMG